MLNYSVKYKTWGEKENKKDVTLLNIKAWEKKEGCYSILCCQPSSLSSLVCDVTQMSKPQRSIIIKVIWNYIKSVTISGAPI